MRTAHDSKEYNIQRVFVVLVYPVEKVLLANCPIVFDTWRNKINVIREVQQSGMRLEGVRVAVEASSSVPRGCPFLSDLASSVHRPPMVWPILTIDGVT